MQLSGATQWDRQAFAFYSDLVYQLAQIVTLPPEIFYQVQVAALPSNTMALVAYAADPLLTLLGPYAPNNPDVELYQTRCVMYLPQKYINTFLSQDFTPPVHLQSDDGSNGCQ